MSSETASPRGRALLLAALLLLFPGLWLRFHALEWMEFEGDELMTMYQPYRAAHERFALHGILTSAGISPPNFLCYVLALPVTLTREPLTLVLFVAAWNLAGLACLLRALWKLVPPAVALAGVALLASTPGPLFFSRKIWNPDFIPASVAALVLLVSLGMEKPRRALVVGIFVVCTLLTGFHLLTAVLLPCVILWAFALRVPLERRGLVLGALAALILLSPYLWFLVSSDFDDARSLAHAHGGGAGEGWFAAFARHAGSALACTVDGGLLAVPALDSWAAAVARGFRAFTAVAALAALACAPWFAVRAWQGRALGGLEKLVALGALLELALLALLAQSRVPAVPHYYAVLIPFPTLAALWLGWRALERFGPLPLLGASALVVGAHTQLFCDFLAELRRAGPPAEMRYALPFKPHATKWRAEIARLFDEIDSGRAAEREEQERLRAAFERSSEVLMRCDPRAADAGLASQGRLGLRAVPEGLEVVGSTAIDMLELPAYDLEGRGRALLRLELDSPKEVAGCIFFQTASKPGYGRSSALRLDTHPGTNVVYFEIPAADARGRLMIRHGAYRWVLRAAEVRRIQD